MAYWKSPPSRLNKSDNSTKRRWPALLPRHTRKNIKAKAFCFTYWASHFQASPLTLRALCFNKLSFAANLTSAPFLHSLVPWDNDPAHRIQNMRDHTSQLVLNSSLSVTLYIQLISLKIHLYFSSPLLLPPSPEHITIVLLISGPPLLFSYSLFST